MRWLLVAAVLGGTEAKADARDTLNLTLLIAAETSLVIDMGQTLGIKTRAHHFELNPLLGPRPNDAKVIGYFAACGAVTAAGWYLVPKQWRFLLPLAVLVVQVPQIERNLRAGATLVF